jgi:glucose/arabinose dehydrogenase
LQFGPDGYLWMGLGDGGHRTNAQKIVEPRGGMIRLDVSTAGTALPAPDNPYVGIEDASEDLWAIGLRNPWRWSYDTETNLIYIGDVGRNIAEEINVQAFDEPALNYGWATIEGSQCFRIEEEDPAPTNCDTTDLLLPTVEVLHPEACSFTGGHVYRGEAIPELDGRYFYAGFVRSFLYADGEATNEVQIADDLSAVTSWGRDRDGEFYVITSDGFTRKLVAA